MRSYEVDGRPLLDGFSVKESSSSARGQLLIPWPNRLRDGRYTFEGKAYQVPLSEPEKHNAIHGLLRWANWRVADRADDRVLMEHTLFPRTGYPFGLHVAVEYSVGSGGLTVDVTATNVGELPCPYGMGAHPYLRVEADSIDACWLEAPGGVRLTQDERAIPVGTESVAGTAYDFRTSRQIVGTELDTAFTELRRDAAGCAWVRLLSRSADHGVGLWMDERYRYYMLYTGDTLPDDRRRRRSLGVEPMTCAPNAFASGDGLITLVPGASVVSRWGITPLGTAS